MLEPSQVPVGEDKFILMSKEGYIHLAMEKFVGK